MTQRKRATGFVLMDAAFTADAKFVRLARQIPDPVEYAACVGVFWMLLADCRRAKSPEVDWDDYTDYSEQIDRLRAALLLTDTGFDPEPFERWAPAYRAPGERKGTGGYATVREGTEGTNTSGQFSSSQVNDVADTSRAREPGTFMGFRPKVTADLDDVKRQHDEAWIKCAECGVVGRKHPASGEHQFRPELRAVR